MSVQTLATDEWPGGGAELGATSSNTAPHALRIFAVAAVCLGVAALAAATFVLSYSAIRAVALQAGVAPRFARDYPLLLDAMLVIVLAAVLGLRGAGLPSRLLAWLTLLLVLVVAAGADAMHTAGRSMPHQAAAITAAILPFVLVLLAFTLLLVMLRHGRLRRLADTADRVSAYGSGWTAAQPADVAAPSHPVNRPVLDAPTPPPREVAMDSDSSTGESVSEPATGTTPYPSDTLAGGWYDGDDDGDAESVHGAPVPGEDEILADGEPDDDVGPVFHRLFSAPIGAEVEMTVDEHNDVEADEVGAAGEPGLG